MFKTRRTLNLEIRPKLNHYTCQLLWNRSIEFQVTLQVKWTYCVLTHIHRKFLFDFFSERSCFDMFLTMNVRMLHKCDNVCYQCMIIWFSVRLPITIAWHMHSLCATLSRNICAWGMLAEKTRYVAIFIFICLSICHATPRFLY